MNADERERRFDFDGRAGRWEAHVRDSRASSNPRVYVEHPTFDELCALGPDIVPLIIERWQNDPNATLFYCAVLAKLMRKTDFGDGLSGNLKDTRAKWLAWFASQPQLR